MWGGAGDVAVLLWILKVYSTSIPRYYTVLFEYITEWGLTGATRIRWYAFIEEGQLSGCDARERMSVWLMYLLCVKCRIVGEHDHTGVYVP